MVTPPPFNKCSSKNTSVNKANISPVTIDTTPYALLERNQAIACTRNVIAYFQPLHRVDTGALHGAEVLARWKHSEYEVLGAAHVQSVFNTADLRKILWDRMLEHALNMLTALNRQDLHINVNVTADVVSSVRWMETLHRRVQQLHLNPTHLTVEITESIGNINESKLCWAVNQLRGSGMGCAIDDFGTGFSSLQRLALMPFSNIKIDRSLIRQARKNIKGTKVLTNIVAMGHDLGLIVTAEGIETEEDFELIATIGCDLAQGYYFGRPMPAEPFRTYTELVHAQPTIQLNTNEPIK